MSRHHQKMSSRLWQATRRACFDRDGWRCQMPGCSVAWPLEAHHVVPLAAGGAEYDVDNCLTLCSAHHVEMHRERLDAQRQAWADFVAELMDDGP